MLRNFDERKRRRMSDLELEQMLNPDPTINYTPVNKSAFWFDYGGLSSPFFGLCPDLSIIGHADNNITWQVSSSSNMSNPTEYQTYNYTTQTPTAEIYQNSVKISTYTLPGYNLLEKSVGTFYMRFKIGQSNWSNILSVVISPTIIF